MMGAARNKVKKLRGLILGLALLVGCSGQPSPNGKGLGGRNPWTANAGRFSPAGVVSFASLSADEICGLADEKLVSKEFGFDFVGIEPNYELGERGSRCGFDATSDGFEGDRLSVNWFVGPPEKLAVSATDALTRSQSFIHGLPVSVSVNGEGVEANLPLNDRLIRVETFTDNDKRREQIARQTLLFLTLVHARAAALRPRAQPAFDAKVRDVFAFSPAQLCSLLRDRTVAFLAGNSVNLAPMKPGAFDVALVRSDFLWCSKGRGKLELQMSAWINRDYSDQVIRGLPSSSSIGLLDAEDQTSEQARLEVAASRPINDGVEQRVIRLIAQGTEYNATSRAILRREMDHIIGELNRRLPKPLIYKL